MSRYEGRRGWPEHGRTAARNLRLGLRRLAALTNSIRVIAHAHQQVLVAVLSDHQPSEAVGIAQVEAVAVAAVDAVTGTS